MFFFYFSFFLFFFFYYLLLSVMGFSPRSAVKSLPASARDAGDAGLISGLGKSPGEGNGNLLQYSCLENPTDRVAWLATGHGVTKELDMT